MSNNQLIIASTAIRQDGEGRYCLNDLHKAVNNENKHRPKYWLENQQTKALIAEIEKGGITPIESKQQVGTFAVKELVYAYAMWVSPRFNLEVIRAYDALVSHPATPQTYRLEALLSAPASPLTLAEVEQRRTDIYARFDVLVDDALGQIPVIISGADYQALRKAAVTMAGTPPPKTRRNWTDAEKKRALEMHAEGKSSGVIGKALGRGAGSVREFLTRDKGGAA